MNTLILPSSISQIGYGAFEHCKLESVTSYIKEPFELYKGTFITTWTEEIFDNGSISYSESNDIDATLYVPTGTREKYLATEGWNLFKNIVEFNPAGIENIEAIEGTAIIYNIKGHKLDKIQKGMNILRESNGRMRKVIIK